MTSPQASGGFDIGTVSGAITFNANGAFSTIQQVKSQITGLINSTSSMFQNMGSQVSSFGTSFTQMMTPFAAGMGLGIKTAGNFQDSIAEIAARTGLTGDALDQIREKSMQLGADSAYSAQQAADAFLQLLTSGSSVEEAMLQIDAVLGGAAASGAGLAFTADMLTDIMSQFGIEASKSAEVMQALVAATGSSSATIDTLSQGFANVGTVAAGFGLTIDETAAALAVLNEQGIKGAEAGTALKTILSELGKPGPREELERLGIAYADANGNIRNFDDILDDINVALSSKTEVEKREIIMALAGSYGQAGLSALLAKDGIDTMLGTMQEQEAFTEIARKKMETFNGQITSLKGSIETLLIEAFIPFIEWLTPFVTQLVGVVNSVRQWVKANQNIVQPMLRMLSVLIMLGPTLFGVGKAISLVGFLIGALTSPINLILIAITALVAAWTTNFLGFRDVTMQVINSVIETFQRLWNAFQVGGFSGAGTFILDNIIIPMLISLHYGAKRLWQQAQNLASGIFDALKTGLPVVATWVNDNIITPLRNGFNSLQNVDWSAVGTNILSALGSAFLTAVAWATWVYTHILQPMFSSAQTAIQSINWSQIGTGIMNAIGAAFTVAVNFATWIYDNILLPIFNNTKSAIESIDWMQVGWDLMNAIGAALVATFSFITWLAEIIFTPLVGNAEAGTQGVDWGQVGTAIMNAIGAFFTGVFSFVAWILETIILPFISGAALAISQADWGGIGQGIMESIRNALPNIAEWVRTNIIQPIQNTLSSFNPMNSIQGGDANISINQPNPLTNPILNPAAGVFGALQTGWKGISSIFNPQHMATGTNFVPQDMLAMLHRGEAVVPREFNPAAGGVTNNGHTFNVTINATPGTNGRAVARDFQSEIEQLTRVTG